MLIEELTEESLQDAVRIWNDVVIDGKAFPQTDILTTEEGRSFFSLQSYCGVCKDENKIVGMYILHPNNVGRCGHICNASYAVDREERGRHVGEILVRDCLIKAKALGFKILQFNAVVESNKAALKLYRKLGFTSLGTIPNGFLNRDNEYENIIVHYKTL